MSLEIPKKYEYGHDGLHDMVSGKEAVVGARFYDEEDIDAFLKGRKDQFETSKDICSEWLQEHRDGTHKNYDHWAAREIQLIHQINELQRLRKLLKERSPK